MTNKHIEALEKMMEYECSTCIVPQGGDCNKCEPKRIYNQALAPQENKGYNLNKLTDFANNFKIVPQECDVTKCEFWNKSISKPQDDLHTCRIGVYTPRKSHTPFCKDNPNCYYKQNQQKYTDIDLLEEQLNNLQERYDSLYQQLHSQEKTFTVEEIENKIKKVEEFYGEQIVTVFINDLLAEFEKECG